MTQAGGARGARLRTWARRFWVPLALAAAAVGIGGTATVAHTQELSPVDEWVYVDYLHKLSEQGVVRQGELIGPQALDHIACHGILWYGTMSPPCGGDYSDPSAFPFEGVTSAADYTPAYFAVTRVVGDAIAAVTGVEQLTGWRLTGVLWLLGGVLLFWRLLQAWRVPDLAILGLGLAFMATPLAWWTFTFVSTDAPAFVFGAALLLVTEAYLRGRASGWWIPVISVVAVLFKVSNILAVCLAALYLLVTWLWGLRRPVAEPAPVAEIAAVAELVEAPPSTPASSTGSGSVRALGFAVLSIVLAIAAQAGWLAVRSGLAEGAAADQGVASPLTLKALLAQFGNFLPGTITANVVLAGGGSGLPVPPVVYAPLAWLCIAGVVAGLLLLRSRDRHLPLVVTVAIASVGFAPMLAVVMYLGAGVYFELPPRYGLPILPGILLAAGLLLRGRAAQIVLLGYAAVLAAIVVTYSLLLGGHLS